MTEEVENVGKPDHELVNAAVDRCEELAHGHFEGGPTFTRITRWDDGDFRVVVKHGKGHEDSPYRQTAEKITYKRDEGTIYYAEVTRYIDRHERQYDESYEIEDYDAVDAVEGPL